LFVTALRSEEAGRFDLLVSSFSRLHEAAAASALSAAAEAILEPSLPRPDLAWDTCERLRQALVSSLAPEKDVPKLGGRLNPDVRSALGRTSVDIGGKELAKRLHLPLPVEK